MFMTNRIPNHTGSKPRSTTTGAKMGTVMKTMAIHSMKVPSSIRISIMTTMMPKGGRSRPVSRLFMKVVPPMML